MATSDMYMFVKRTPQQHEFAFLRSSLPSKDDEVVDGAEGGEALDGNN